MLGKVNRFQPTTTWLCYGGGKFFRSCLYEKRKGKSEGEENLAEERII